jgi:hypothetical protein
MRHLGLQRIAGLGAIHTMSNITAFELLFDNERFSLVWFCYFIAMLGFACASDLKRLYRKRALILNYCRRVFDKPQSDELLRKSLFQSTDSNDFYTPLSYRLPRKQLFNILILVNHFDCTTCGWATLE